MPLPRTLTAVAGALVTLAATAATAAADCPGALPAGTCAYTAGVTVGERTGGVLRFPQAVAVGPDGAVYVADQKSHAITVFNPDGSFRGDLGVAGSKPGQLTSVGGVAVAGDGSVLVATGADRIDRFAPGGNVLASWGTTGQGVGQFVFGAGGGNDSPAGGGLAVSGNLVYVADSRNDRVQRFTLDGGEGRVIVGPGQLQTPMGIAVRKSRVLVADDQHHRIAVYDTGGRFLSAIGGGEGSVGGQLQNPYDVATDSAGRVFVADDLNHRVVRYAPQPAFGYRYKARWGTYGTAPGRLAYPRGIAVDGQGLVYVTNTGNDRIDVFDRSGKLVRSMGRSGRGTGQFDTPSGVAADAAGFRAVADTVNGRVQLLGPDGAVVSVMGSPNPGPTILPDPEAVAFDAAGNVYALDQRKGKVVVFSRATGLPVRTFGLGLLAQPSAITVSPGGTVFVADTGNHRIARFTVNGDPLAPIDDVGAARGVAVTPDAARIYVSTASDNRVRAYDANGTLLLTLGGIGHTIGKLVSPGQITLDAAQNLWVADRGNARVQEFGPNGERLAAFGTRGTGPGQFVKPNSISVDCHGTLTVADTDNNRVQQFALAAPPAAACAALTPIGVPPTPQYPILPAPDGPIMTVKVLRRTGLTRTRSLPVAIGCDTPCTVTASATLTPRAAPKAPPKREGHKRRPAPRRVVVTLGASPLSIGGGDTKVLRLTFSRRDAQRLRKALGRLSGLSAVVELTAKGDAGDPTSQTLELKVSG